MPPLLHCQINFKPFQIKAASYLNNAATTVNYGRKQLEISRLLDEAQEDDSLKGLVLVDTIQRFGINHYFEDQITQTLEQQYQHYSQSLLYDKNDDLYAVSLRFRLLRQQGFHVPADVFKRFKGENMKFKDALSEDIRGLMALHEASHLCIEDEHILDEASIFTTNLLTERLPHLHNRQALMVQNTLQYPYHKTLAHFTAKNYLNNHHLQNDWEKILADLAIMDFNVSQYIYHQEVPQVFKWWRELDLSEELNLAKSQPLKWYIWSVAMGNDPRFSKHRVEIIKPISLVYVVDVIFDVYGTLDELTLFTEAINRWEFSATDKLPSYMKMCFKVIHDTTHEISNVVCQEFGWNPIDYLKKEWASLCNAFLTEAKWFASGHPPKTNEYLKNGIISSGVPMLLTYHFFLLGYGQFTGTTHIEGIRSSVGAILRLLDDLGTAKDEEQAGKDGSYMVYYMKEQQGWSLSDGRQHVMDMVSQQWKLLNKYCLSSTPIIPKSFKIACLNVARLVPMMYNNYNDTHRLPVLEEYVKFMFSNIMEELMF